MGISIRFEIHIHVDYGEKRIEKTVSGVSCKQSLLKRAGEEMEKLCSSLSQSTIENYKTALRSFSRYLNGDVLISNVDQKLIKGFERWLRDRNVCPNSASCYMRSLRSLINRINGEDSTKAFKSVYTGRAKTEKRAVAESDIIRVKNTQLKSGSFMELARNLFLFSYYALGMPFVDMAFARRSQIFDNKLVYHRHKTGKRIVVPLEPCMQEIINRYKSDSDYIFPLLSSYEPQIAYREYLLKLNRYNRSLKLLSKKAGLNLRLTSYTARHTWASVANASNVDLSVISKALGHTNPQTTLTYIKDINDNRLAEANRMILSRL